MSLGEWEHNNNSVYMYTFFHDLVHVYTCSPRVRTDILRGNFDYLKKLLLLATLATSFRKSFSISNFQVDFRLIFFMILCM